MLRSKRGSPSARPMIVAWGCFMATAGGCQKAASQPDLGPPPASIAAPVTQQAAPVSDVEITRAIERHFQDEALLRSVPEGASILLVEDGVTRCGWGEGVFAKLGSRASPTVLAGYPDQFVPHGSPEALEKLVGLSTADLATSLRELLGEKAD